MTAEFVFWSSLLFIIYTYFLYPLLVLIQARVFSKKYLTKNSSAELPKVSVIIAAHNEQERIVERLINLVEQDYPTNLMEVIVVSDGSSDKTELLVARYVAETRSNIDITLIRLDEPYGKPTAINTGVKRARGELLVFGDCRQRFAENAISELVASFDNAKVGCVSGELVFTEGAKSDIATEMGAYWNYEKKIRKLESDSGSVMGVTGAVYCIRKELFVDIPSTTILDDVVVPLDILKQGFKVGFNEKAKAFDTISKDVTLEWSRKVRTLAGNWQLFSIRPTFFNPIRFELFFRLLSHKIFRVFVPFALVVALISSSISSKPLYSFFFYSQVIFYLIGLGCIWWRRLRKISLCNLIFFFCVLNAAAFVGFTYWVSGQSSTLWRQTKSAPQK